MNQSLGTLILQGYLSENWLFLELISSWLACSPLLGSGPEQDS